MLVERRECRRQAKLKQANKRETGLFSHMNNQSTREHMKIISKTIGNG